MLKLKFSDFFKTIFDPPFAIVVFILCLYWFHYIWYNVPTDIQTHAIFIRNIHDGIITYPANFLYYLTVDAISGFNTSNLAFASILTLSLAVLLKFLISKKIINEILPLYNGKKLLTNLIAFLMLIIMSLPSLFFVFSKCLYIGTYPVNIWHNSTTIFVLPFSILLFWLSYKQIEEYKLSRLIYILVLIIVNILIKPSFLFVFILAYPLVLFFKTKFSKFFWINNIPLLFGIIFLIIEYVIIYNINNPSHENGVAIRPFYLMQHYLGSKNLVYTIVVFIISLITSYLFPIIYMFRNPDERKNHLILYALLCVLIAIVIRLTLVETGIREFNGNFAWQVIICSYILFLILASRLFNNLIVNKWDLRKFRVEIIALSLHLFFGLIYISKIVFLQTYD